MKLNLYVLCFLQLATVCSGSGPNLACGVHTSQGWSWAWSFANPNIDLELDCIFGKPMKHRFQRCIVRMEILSTFYVESNTFMLKIRHWNHLANGGSQPQKPPLPLRHVDPHSVRQCLGAPHSPRQTTARLVHALLHNYATKAPLVTMPQLHPKTAPSPSTITTII